MPRAFMRLGLRMAFRNAALPFGVRRNSSSQRQQITESPSYMQTGTGLQKPLHGCALMLPGTLQVPECMQFWHVLGCSTLNEFFATCSRKAVSNASWEASTACQCIQPPWSESCRGCNSAFHICSRHDLSPSLVFSCTVFWQFTKNLWQAFAHKQCHCLT